jgi:hypothetical protein
MVGHLDLASLACPPLPINPAILQWPVTSRGHGIGGESGATQQNTTKNWWNLGQFCSVLFTSHAVSFLQLSAQMINHNGKIKPPYP